MAGRYIEKAQFVRPLFLIASCNFYRISRIAKSLKTRAFYNAATIDVQAGDDPFS